VLIHVPDTISQGENLVVNKTDLKSLSSQW
jgi:hypothetical protein